MSVLLTPNAPQSPLNSDVGGIDEQLDLIAGEMVWAIIDRFTEEGIRLPFEYIVLSAGGGEGVLNSPWPAAVSGCSVLFYRARPCIPRDDLMERWWLQNSQRKSFLYQAKHIALKGE